MRRKSPAGNPLPDPGALCRMVLVEWRNSDFSAFMEGYDTEEEGRPYLILWSVGFVLREDADGIVLGDQHEDNTTVGRLRHVLPIPRKSIIQAWELPDPRPVQKSYSAHSFSAASTEGPEGRGRGLGEEMPRYGCTVVTEAWHSSAWWCDRRMQ